MKCIYLLLYVYALLLYLNVRDIFFSYDIVVFQMVYCHANARAVKQKNKADFTFDLILFYSQRNYTIQKL